MGFPMPQVGDIVFSFQDSCNCCRTCFRRPNEEIYVNGQGNVERYSRRKANDDSIGRTIDHITQQLRQISEQLNIDFAELHNQVQLEVGIEYEPRTPILRETIDRINQLILERSPTNS